MRKNTCSERKHKMFHILKASSYLTGGLPQTFAVETTEYLIFVLGQVFSLGGGERIVQLKKHRT